MSRWRMLPYRIAGGLAALIGIPYLLLYRRSELHERLGGGKKPRRPGCIWVHAASLGEFEAAWPIVRVWGERFGPERLLVSCTNRTALGRLMERLPAETRCRLAPLDLAPVVQRALDWEKPVCILFVETELWPEWIVAAANRSIPTAIVSARLSDRSFPRYRRLKYFLQRIVARLLLVSCRTEEDRRRWCAIGLPVSRSFVWGNTKYDAEEAPSYASPLGRNDRFVLVAGSMREGEQAILDLPIRLRRRAIRLIIAPRHLNHLDEWERGCIRRGLSVRRISVTGIDPTGEVGLLRRQLRGPDDNLPTVLLADKMGTLRAFYRLADLAFVGGTWAPIGGHNLFEPAREGIPVLFGPSIGTVRDVAERLLENGGGWQVEDLNDLARVIETVLDDPQRYHQASRAARKVAEQLAGGARRTLEGLDTFGFPPTEGRGI